MRLSGAMLKRELLSIGRSHRLFALRLAVCLAVMVLIVVMLQPRAMFSSRQMLLDTSFWGQQVYRYFMNALGLLVFVAIPLLTAPIIAGERENRTLSLLMLSNLSPRRILVDKLVVRLTYLLLLIATVIPLSLMFHRLGGMDAGLVTFDSLWLLVEVILMLSLGLLCTAFMRTTLGALIATYLLALALHLGVNLIHGLAYASYYRRYYTPYNFGNFGTRFPADDRDWLSWTISLRYVEMPASYALVGACILLIVCISLVAWWLPRLRDDEGPSWIKQLFRYLDGCFDSLVKDGPRLRDRPLLKRYPVFWRESHGHFYTSRVFCLRLALLVAVVAVGGGMVLLTIDGDWLVPLYLAMLAALAVAALSLGSTAFSRDIQQGRLITILSTPASPWQYIAGKWVGSLKPLLILWLGLLALYGIMEAAAGGNRLYWFLHSVLVGIWQVAFLILATVAAGMWFSLLFKRAALAVSATVLIILGCLIVNMSTQTILGAPLIVVVSATLLTLLSFNRLTGRIG